MKTKTLCQILQSERGIAAPQGNVERPNRNQTQGRASLSPARHGSLMRLTARWGQRRPTEVMGLELWVPRARAFTLIEIMVVVAVIGILAAAIIPQFMTTKHDARVSAAKGHIAELEAALERFNVHMDRYPTADEGLKVLVDAPSAEDKKWRGPYIKQLRPDPWGNQYQYRYPGVHHTASFDLWSRGADGADGGEGEGADIGNWQ